MKNDWHRVIGWILVAIVGCCGVAAVVHILVTVPFDGKGPEWIGAIGSIAALVMTIFLATTETRRREKNESLVAEIHAQSMYLRVAELARVIWIMRIDMLNMPARLTDVEVHGCAEMWANMVRSYKFWTVDELVPIIPFSRKAVSHLVRASNQFAGFERISNPEVVDQNAFTPRERVNQYQYVLHLIHEELLRAEEELRVSSQRFNQAWGSQLPE